MPQDNAANKSISQPNGRKRPALGRVEPAIPLALSRPQPAKTQTKTQTNARAGTISPAKKQPASPDKTESTALAANGRAGSEEWSSTALPAEQADSRVTASSEPTPEDSVPTSLSNGVSDKHKVQLSAEGPLILPPAIPRPTVITKEGSPSTDQSQAKLSMEPVGIGSPQVPLTSAKHRASQSTDLQGLKSVQAKSDPRPHFSGANNIAFGGEESPVSSPMPSLGGSAFQPPPSVPQGHAHHISEPFAQRIPPPGYGSTGIQWHARPGYPQMPQPPYIQPHASVPIKYPPREVFTPSEARELNGDYSRSRSTSQKSSGAPQAGDSAQSPFIPNGSAESAKTTFYEPKTVFPPHLRHHNPGHFLSPPTIQHPDVAAKLENAEALQDHIYAHFSNPAFADCHLRIVDEETGHQNHLDCHKLVLARSPTFLSLIQNSQPPAAGTLMTQLHVSLKGRYVHTKPFIESIRYLYGGPFLQIGWSGYRASNEERMQSALESIATGAWLRVSVIATRGVDAAANLLQWDTMAAVLAFALDGGLGPNWTIEDGSEDRISCSSSDDSLGRSDGWGTPTYDPYATQLLHRTIDFTVHMFPPNFYLDASAPQLASCPRLPSPLAGHENRPTRADPRLSQIRFGEIPVEDHQRPSLATTTISSVLLSLPFALLKCVLEHDILAGRLGSDTVSSIMRQVVAEREVRRQRVLKARPPGRMDDISETPLLQNLYWEELVEYSQHHKAGFRLVRRRRGIDTPSSSGAISDQSK